MLLFSQLEANLVFFSGLGILSLVPIKPADDKPRRLTNLEKSEFSLSEPLKEILVGSLLGDLHAEKQSVNVRLKFAQGILHADYILQLYKLFQNFCPETPKIENSKPHRRTGKVYSSIYFRTYSLPCFNELYELFYPEGKKIVPLNIGDLLTPLGLCYLIADDGSCCKVRLIVTLCTESFTLAEVTLLANTLNDKWDLKCYINKTNNGGFRILIPRKSLPVLQSLLKDIMPPMMLYKIGL